jgi:hypothetical protein
MKIDLSYTMLAIKPMDSTHRSAVCDSPLNHLRLDTNAHQGASRGHHH